MVAQITFTRQVDANDWFLETLQLISIYIKTTRRTSLHDNILRLYTVMHLTKYTAQHKAAFQFWFVLYSKNEMNGIK